MGTRGDRVTERAPQRAMRRSGLFLILGLAGLVIAVAGIRAASELVSTVFLSLVIAILADPLRVRLTRAGWPPAAVAAAIFGTVFVVLLAFVGVGIVSVSQLSTLMPQYQD